MANKNQRNSNESIKKIKFCSINIDGFSERSKFSINKYNHTEDFDVLFTQETGTDDSSRLELNNMSVITDTNKSVNRGVALHVNEKHSVIKLECISKLSKVIDSCWGLVIISNRRLIIGNVYVKLNCKPAMKDISKMLIEAEKCQKQYKATGIILSGDFNARHVSWGDKTNNFYGKQLIEEIDFTKFSISTSKTPTFLGAKGASSYIDLNIISNDLADSVFSCKTNEEVELFSGAPSRGHVPLITEFKIATKNNNPPVIEKLNIESMNWCDWTNYIENQIEEKTALFATDRDPFDIWNSLNEILTVATDKYCETKKSSIHSKPYWTETLTRLANELRAARKNYTKRNTDYNLRKLKEARETFDEERKTACQNFLINSASQLNASQAQKFWSNFNKIFRKKSKQKVDPLLNSDGDLLTEIEDLDNCLFSAFFECKHLSEENFDDMFYQEINNIYEKIINEDQSLNDSNEYVEATKNLNDDISFQEIKKAIRTNGKSTDNSNFHPQMLKHLGAKAITTLQLLFNLCLKTHKWIWKSAEVIFLRKPGKDTYAKSGSYRPICITSYIGKLLEAILTNRIETFLINTNQIDPFQEGFSAKKNTIRYLNRLHLSICADIELNLTSIGLFIDFEKAFDSVWKKGLIVKLHQLGVQGNIARLINNFLISREIKLNVNGHLGQNRQTLEYGLPQGSVISPLLFKIFVQDFVSELSENPNITLLKFADDGTIKVNAKDSVTCVNHLNSVLESLHKWSRKWRLKINCDKNKTEIICFNCAEGDKTIISNNFKLGNKEIQRVPETKVLGLIIDENLSYKPHSEALFKSLLGRWATICKFSNRYWGFNTTVMLHLFKALFLSKFSYAGHIWYTKENSVDINQLFYRILKAITGAVLNIDHNIAELILGIPPLSVQTKIHSIKHFLKINSTPVSNDVYKTFLNHSYDESTKSPSVIHSKLKEVYDFLVWKEKLYPQHFTNEDRNISLNRKYKDFSQLSEKCCYYTRNMINKFTQEIWSRSSQNKFQLKGYPTTPIIKCSPIAIPKNTPRETEVKVISLFYKNNLLNQSLWNIDRAPSPLCPYCNSEEETSDHLLFRCSFVDERLRMQMNDVYQMSLKLCEFKTEPEYFIGLLSVCHVDKFIKACIDIVNCLNIKVHVVL